MLTPEGCAARRRRLIERLDPSPDWAIVADPRHVMYLTNLPVEPISWSHPAPRLLLIDRDGQGMLVLDNLAARGTETVWVERLEIAPWYDQLHSPGDRRLAVIRHFLDRLPRDLPESIAVETRAVPVELLRQLAGDLPGEGLVPLDDTLLAMRTVKDPDELELLRRCIRAGEAGQARSWAAVGPGRTELEVYREVAGAAVEAAGQPAIVYGDFCSGPRGWTDRGGPPTGRKLEAGDLMLLDFSVVIGGYRGDFTNTIAVGGRPSAQQQRLSDLCRQAMASGERSIRPGAPAREIWQAVNAPLEAADPGLRLTHHAGHGIGLAHPEPPILVRHSTDTLAAGHVITLEPGAYVEGVGGLRIENNYLVTAAGFERLTHHRIGLA